MGESSLRYACPSRTGGRGKGGACKAEGLEVFSIYAGGKVNADGFEIDNGVAAAITLLKGTGALVELNVQRGEEPNDEQAIALVRHVADLAKEAGLKVVLFPHANFHIERFDHALKIAKATERDNVGVAFNLCHFLKIQPNDDLPALLAGRSRFSGASASAGRMRTARTGTR